MDLNLQKTQKNVSKTEKNTLSDFVWVTNVISSCKTEFQTECCKHLAENFLSKHNDFTTFNALIRSISAKFAEINRFSDEKVAYTPTNDEGDE